MPVEEWQRKTERVTLRLRKDLMRQLRERAEQEGLDLNAYIARLIEIDLAIR